MADLREQWEAEKLGLSDVKSLRQALDQCEGEFNRLEAAIKDKQSVGAAVSESDYQQLFELDQKQRKLRAQIEQDEQHSHRESNPNQRRLLRTEVTADEVAEVVSHWTGVPVTRMMETERAKLLDEEERLHQRVIGQNRAIERYPMR